VVWFGPKGPESTERELAAFLGSHNGIAVLRWPRDADRATRLVAMGIPCLCLVASAVNLPPLRPGLQEWLPQTANDFEIHACIGRLNGRATARRTAAGVELDDGWLKFGEYRVQLAPYVRPLADALIARFEEAVDDDLLVRAVGGDAGPLNTPLSSRLFHLDQLVNPLGLEVVPTRDGAHLIRRCRP
jgi:hypothetical protein